MTPKRKAKDALAKLRSGPTILPPIKEVINSISGLDDEEQSLEDYANSGGGLDYLKGEALGAYLELQNGKQKRQLENTNVELEETLQRIRELLNANGFLATLNPADLKQEREASFFRIIQECQGREDELQSNVLEYLNLHMAKSQQQYDTMKEIEQWFHDLVNDKSFETEFNDELASMKFRHIEHAVSQKNVEKAIDDVALTALKLKDIGEILGLSNEGGIKIVDGLPPDEESITLLVPTESGTEFHFHFTVILDDELIFRNQKVQMLAEQYLKGLIFYGAAAKHRNRAQKRKVIRLVMRQLKAIYKFITRLRNAILTYEQEISWLKVNLNDLQNQKDHLFRENATYAKTLGETENAFKKLLEKEQTCRLERVTLEDTLKLTERRAAQAEDNVAKTAKRTKGKESHGTTILPGTDLGQIGSADSMDDALVIHHTTADKEIQVTNINVSQHHRGTLMGPSLISLIDEEIQPSFEKLSPEEIATVLDAKEQLNLYEETVTNLSNDLEILTKTAENCETRRHELETAVVQTKKAPEENAEENINFLLQTAEADKEKFNKQVTTLAQEAATANATVQDLHARVVSHEVTIRKDTHEKISVGSLTEAEFLMGISQHAQTNELTPRDMKTELQKLKVSLGTFRKSIVNVLINQNLVADVPPFREQLRDNWNPEAAAAEVADSNEDMRKIRLKLQQRILKLEVDNDQVHETLKSMGKLLEDRQQDFDSQLVQQEQHLAKQRDETRRVKELAWTLAESLAKLRDEHVSKTPERKSLIDMMNLLQIAEHRLGKKLRGSIVGHEKSTPQLSVQGIPLTDPLKPVFRTPSQAGIEPLENSGALRQSISSTTGTDVPRKMSVVGHNTNKRWQSFSGKDRPSVRDKRSLPIISTRTKGSTTSDKVSRVDVQEYTRYYFDPVNESLMSETREVRQANKKVQTMDEHGVDGGLPADGTIPDQYGEMIVADRVSGPQSYRQPKRTIIESGFVLDEVVLAAEHLVELDAADRDSRPSYNFETKPVRPNENGRPMFIEKYSPAPSRSRSNSAARIHGIRASIKGSTGAQLPATAGKLAASAGQQSAGSVQLSSERNADFDKGLVHKHTKDPSGHHAPMADSGASSKDVKSMHDQKADIIKGSAAGTSAFTSRPVTGTPEADKVEAQRASDAAIAILTSLENDLVQKVREIRRSIVQLERHSKRHEEQESNLMQSELRTETEKSEKTRANDGAHRRHLEKHIKEPESKLPPDGEKPVDGEDELGGSQERNIKQSEGQLTAENLEYDDEESRDLSDNEPVRPDMKMPVGTEQSFEVEREWLHKLEEQAKLVDDRIIGAIIEKAPRRGDHRPSDRTDKEKKVTEVTKAAYARDLSDVERGHQSHPSSDAAPPLHGTLPSQSQKLDPENRTNPEQAKQTRPKPLGGDNLPATSEKTAKGENRAQDEHVKHPVTPTFEELKLDEAHLLGELAKIRQARAHFAKVQGRLGNLEQVAESHSRQSDKSLLTGFEPTKSTASRQRYFSPELSEDQDVHRRPSQRGRERSTGVMTKESLTALRGEVKGVKEDIKAMALGSRGCKAQRSIENEEGISLEQMPSGEMAVRREKEEQRERRISEAKHIRQRRMEGLHFVISKFVQDGPRQKRMSSLTEERSSKNSETRKQKQRRDSQKKTMPEASPRGSVRERFHSTAIDINYTENECVEQIKAEGFSLESKNAPRMDDERGEQNTPVKTAAHRRREPSLAELKDGSIMKRLQHLQDERMALAPQYVEKKQANPLIRTHRCEELCEGPVDLSPPMFPEMGVIGRTISKVTKHPHPHWEPYSSIVGNETANRTAPRSPSQKQ